MPNETGGGRSLSLWDMPREEKIRIGKLIREYLDPKNKTQKARIYRLFREVGQSMSTEQLKVEGLKLIPEISAAEQEARFLCDEGLIEKYQEKGHHTKTWRIQ